MSTQYQRRLWIKMLPRHILRRLALERKENLCMLNVIFPMNVLATAHFVISL